MSTSELLDRVLAIDLAAVPPDVIDQVKRSIADTLSVGLGATGETYGRMVIEHAMRGACAPQATVWGTIVKTSAPQAAFANGALAHGLDFDDMLEPVIGHPSASVVAATMAAAEARGLDGRRLLESCVTGLECAGRLGEMVNVGHYRKGWHPTSVLGAVATAVAVSRLIGLDRVATARAMGIAVTFAAGVRGTFGTPVKGLQVGNAARAGLEAAEFAEAGFAMHADILERRFGFFEMFSEDGSTVRANAPTPAPGVAGTVARYGMGYKRYPSCGRIQPAADAMLWLRRKHGLVAEDVVSIRCGTYDMAVKTLAFPRPRNGYEARYSMNYCLAAALYHGNLDLVHFQDARTADPAVHGVIDRVELTVDSTLPSTERFPSRIELTLRNGRQVRALGLRGAGSGTTVVTDSEQEELPITDAGLRQKWNGCFEAAGAPRASLGAMLQAIGTIERARKLDDLISTISYSRS